MAVKTKNQTKRKYADGTIVWFKAYEDGADGELNAGDKLKITGFDEEQEVYNVETEDGQADSVFDTEFTTEDPEAEQKPARKKAAKVVVEDNDEDEDEGPVKAVVTKKSAKAVIEIEEEPAKPVKASKKKKVEVVEEDEEEEEVVAPKKESKKSKKVVEEDDEDEEPVVEQKKRGRKPKVEVEDEEDTLGEFVSTESVTKTLKLHKGNALDAAKDLAETKERTIFTLGGVLAYVKRNESFSKIKDEDGQNKYEKGLVGFNEYVKEELGIEARSAAYYVDLYEMFSKVTTEAKIAKIGWTKLRELLPLRQSINTDNVDEWLDKAKNSTAAELHESVTKSLVDAGEDIHGNRVTAKQVKFSFVVHNDQESIVKEAIDLAKEILGEDATDSAALVHIFGEWLQMQDSE